MQYKTIDKLLDLIDEPNRSACRVLMEENLERFKMSPGSLIKHQAWPNGYIQHLEETMNFGVGLFEMMNDFRKLDFTISDVILVLFLHDLEKPFRYVEPKKEFLNDEEKKKFINEMVGKYEIVLDENHINALQYIHGEGDEYNRTERIQKPLAAFVHVCDTISSRVWFDCPK